MSAKANLSSNTYRQDAGGKMRKHGKYSEPDPAKQSKGKDC